MNKYKPMELPGNITNDSDTCGLTFNEDNGLSNGECTIEELNISISQLEDWIVRRSLNTDNLWALWNIITFGTRLFSIQFTFCIALLALLKSLYNFNSNWKHQLIPQNALSQDQGDQDDQDDQEEQEDQEDQEDYDDQDDQEDDDDDDDDEYFLTESDDDDTSSEEFMECLESLPHDQEAGEQLNAEYEDVSQSSEEQHNDMEIVDTSEVSDISAPVSGSSVNYQEEFLPSESENDVIQFIGDLEEAVDNISEDRVAIFVSSAINREAEEYLQAMYPSVNNILCSLYKKSEEYTQAEQDDDDDLMQDTSISDQESGELQTKPEDSGITDSTTSNEFFTLSETQSEYMSSTEDLQDDTIIEYQADSDDVEAEPDEDHLQTELEDFMQTNIYNTLDAGLKLKSKDTSANGENPQETREFENQSDTESFNAMGELDQESASPDMSTTESTGSDEIIPKTVNLDGTIQLVLYTPDGEPCILDCTVINDG
ncbi:hypothetical protein ACLKA7_011748 [Drosophila subpalustris]